METTAGILTLLIGIIHIFYGERVQLPRLSNSTDDTLSIASARVMVYQGGIMLILTGLYQFLSGIHTIQLIGIAVYIPIVVILANFLTFLLTAVLKHRLLLSVSIPQILIFTIIIVLQIIAIV